MELGDGKGPPASGPYRYGCGRGVILNLDVIFSDPAPRHLQTYLDNKTEVAADKQTRFFGIGLTQIPTDLDNPLKLFPADP